MAKTGVSEGKQKVKTQLDSSLIRLIHLQRYWIRPIREIFPTIRPLNVFCTACLICSDWYEKHAQDSTIDYI